MARPAAAGLSSRVWATRAPAPEADLRQADARAAVRDSSLSMVAGRARRDAGLGSPVGRARRRRSPDRAVCRVLRASSRSAGTSARDLIRRPRGHRAPAGLPGALVRARPSVRQRARLPGPARRPVGAARKRSRPQDAQGAPSRPADRGTPDHGAAAQVAPDSDRRWVLRVPPDPHLASIPATTRWTRGWSAGASSPGSPAARSWRSRWTPASWPAGTSARSHAIARSPRSSMPAPSRPSATSGLASATRIAEVSNPQGVSFGRRYGVKFRAALTSFVYLAFVSLLKLADPLRPDR
jgi:hypothetical protein